MLPSLHRALALRRTLRPTSTVQSFGAGRDLPYSFRCIEPLYDGFVAATLMAWQQGLLPA
ncbi:hypothetical protein [Roseateles sp. BYS87W]|uniref:Uncharacterized protein n=1 Tax=Pelomonas baiyunensis TaxID=3299026 RepID=A0ABW7H2K9_9BURK